MIEKPALVLVPGMSGRPEVDFPFLGPMLRRRFEVTEVTFEGLEAAAGRGQLEGLEQPSFAALLERVEAAVLACETSPLVVGYSLGAVVAARLVSATAGLVLIAGWWQPAPKLLAFATTWAQLRAERSAALDRVTQHALYSAAGWDAAHTLPADALTDALIALAARTALPEGAPLAEASTLVIGCSHDEVATTRQTQLLFGALPDARYAEVPSGHAVTHERPAELVELITSFAAAPDRFPTGSIVTTLAP